MADRWSALGAHEAGHALSALEAVGADAFHIDREAFDTWRCDAPLGPRAGERAALEVCVGGPTSELLHALGDEAAALHAIEAMGFSAFRDLCRWCHDDLEHPVLSDVVLPAPMLLDLVAGLLPRLAAMQEATGEEGLRLIGVAASMLPIGGRLRVVWRSGALALG